MSRRLLVLVLLMATVPVLSHSRGMATPPQGAVSKEAAVKEAATEAAAQAAARQSNARVAVSALRTETQEVFANPNGTFTLEQNTLPVRVKQGATWVAVDATLRLRPDGSVRPVATAVPMAFSGGGTSPLARISSGGRFGDREVTMGWPAPLPAPTLSGDTATYANVLPDVDLVLTADPMGFSEVLVVKTPAAARHPDLKRLRLGLDSSNGLAMRVDAAGNIDAVDPNGEPMFHAGTPMMWDSSGGADRRGFAAMSAPLKHKAMRTTASATGALTIEPDESMLSDATVTYPLFLDPSVRWTGGRLAWTSVWKAYPTSSYFNSSDIARVGHENDSGMTNRSFFRMNTTTVKGKHIIAATLRTFETHAWSCSARQVEVWRTGTISASTTWNAQPSWITKLQTLNVAKGYSTSCPDANVDFNVTAGVATSAAANAADLTLGLRSTSETDTFAWKKFQNNPTLIIDYNSLPTVPNTLSVDPGLPCVVGAGRPVVGTLTPTLRAKLADVDSGQLVGARFEWWVTGGSKISEAATTKVASGSIHSITIPANVFIVGGTYSWRVRGEDGTDVSAFTSFCEMTIDPYPPVSFPAVTSPVYPATPPESQPIYRGAVGIPGPFTLAPGAGDTDIAGYVYGLNQYPPQTSIAASGTGKTATVTLTPSNAELNTLYVQSRDGVGNLGPIYGYQFYVRTAAMPVGHWPLDESGGVNAGDASGSAQTATTSGTVNWAAGRLGGGAQIAGNGSIGTATPVLRTDMSFAVSAWVRLTNTFAHYAVVSQDGTRNSGFYLRYEGDIDRWGFGMYTADTDTEVLHRAVSTAPPRYHVWTHLLGVYDSAAGQLRLYVDGVPAGTTAHTGAWNATGGLQIGRTKWHGFLGDYWQGGIDDVRAYQSVPPAETIAELSHPPAVLVGHWRLDETAGTIGADASGAGRTATLSAGCSWAPGWFDGSLSAAGACDAAVGSPVVRTDQSFTVSAWLRFTGATQSTLYTAVSQDGAVNSGFLLQYLTGENVWGFTLPTADSTSDTYVTARSSSPVTLDVWTHVAGVYDATTGQLKIYVDGLLSGIVAHTNPWHAAGSLEIGRAKWHGFLGDWWRGGIDDVRVFQGALTDDEVYQLTVQ